MLSTFLDLQVSLAVEDQVKSDPVNCANMVTFFFVYIFFFSMKLSECLFILGLPPTYKPYCSYVPMFDDKNVRVSFLMIHLLKKSIYILHTYK